MYSLSRDRKGLGRERERVRERERLLLGKTVMELHTHQSIFLVQINLWLSFNHRNVKYGISLVLDTG